MNKYYQIQIIYVNVRGFFVVFWCRSVQYVYYCVNVKKANNDVMHADHMGDCDTGYVWMCLSLINVARGHQRREK